MRDTSRTLKIPAELEGQINTSEMVPGEFAFSLKHHQYLASQFQLILVYCEREPSSLGGLRAEKGVIGDMIKLLSLMHASVSQKPQRPIDYSTRLVTTRLLRQAFGEQINGAHVLQEFKTLAEKLLTTQALSHADRKISGLFSEFCTKIFKAADAEWHFRRHMTTDPHVIRD